MAVEFLSKASVTLLWQKINALVDTKMAQAGVSSITPNDIYPVGSIYYTSLSTFNPNDVASFPGTWVRVAEGQFIVTSGTGTGTNGQSKTFVDGANGGIYSQSISEAQLPIHSHSMAHTHTVSEDEGHIHTPSNTSEKFLASDANIMINGTARTFPSTGGTANFVYTTNPKNGIDEVDTAKSGEHTHTVSECTDNTGSKGAGATLNTTPPAFGLYAWQRTV